MIQKDISKYLDPDDLELLGNNIKYPYSTQYMRYSALTHKYYLTNKALEDYGIDVQNLYMSNSPKKLEQFIDEVTDDIYDCIGRFAPYNLQYNMFLIAQSKSLQFPDRYTCRKQF